MQARQSGPPALIVKAKLYRLLLLQSFFGNFSFFFALPHLYDAKATSSNHPSAGAVPSAAIQFKYLAIQLLSIASPLLSVAAAQDLFVASIQDLSVASTRDPAVAAARDPAVASARDPAVESNRCC